MELIVLLVVLALRRLDVAWSDLFLAHDRLNHVLQPIRDKVAQRSLSPLAEWGLLVLLPVLLIGVAMSLLSAWLWGIPAFFAGILLLLWLLGGRSEFRDTEDLLIRARMNDAESLAVLATERVGMAPDQDPSTSGYFPNLLRTILTRDVRHLFATLFWFMVFGYWAAAFYALNLNWLKDREEGGETARMFQTVLLWIPARVMLLCMALAGNFGKVSEAVAHRLWQVDDSEQLLEEALPGAMDLPLLEDAADLSAGADQLEKLQGLLLRCMALWLILAALWILLAA